MFRYISDRRPTWFSRNGHFVDICFPLSKYCRFIPCLCLQIDWASPHALFLGELVLQLNLIVYTLYSIISYIFLLNTNLTFMSYSGYDIGDTHLRGCGLVELYLVKENQRKALRLVSLYIVGPNQKNCSCSQIYMILKLINSICS